ncbi:TetR/AcrR family transcriptional regulator [Sediminibacterium sp.]|uniref:TetR/AcrR family transcriptional regulator n=1 Tax=Sediminibacterium sp. TaxID=1917865 RepID=UPI002735502F|nr:TetR/AcrR family transcriptional regulator [Sediminibacterium sp.]MDP3393919.1 TetR/AcrR family transcriptional regulator [Sediminibacterium sp.]MDP3568750.1 TetR/AcrR family transcriptional regulator [Sediminibacterium sp.]
MVKEEIFKEDIIREAQKLFQTYGLKKTTMEDIAKALGKGKSTLYYYYQSKEQIFEEVLQKELQEVFIQTQFAVETVHSAEEKLKIFAVTRIKVLSNMLNLYRLVCGDFVEHASCAKGLFNEYSQKEINLIKSILEFGINSGEFNKALEQEMDLLPSVVVSSIRGIERDFFNDKLIGLEHRIGAISNLMVNGLKNK